jgi:hypothetical protein
MKSEDLVVGRQIVYTAPGTDKQEFGFVTSWHDETAFCRFWNKHDNTSLRTIANSESCYIQDLQVYAAVPQEFVIKTINMLRANPEKYGWYEQGDEK